MRKNSLFCIVLFFMAGVFISSCGAGQLFGPPFTPTPTITPTPSITPTPTLTSTPTITPTATLSPTATLNPDWMIFDHKTIRLAYPQDWNVEDRSNDKRCIPDLINCLLRITAPDDPNTRITLIMTNLSFFEKTIDIEAADQAIWDAETAQFAQDGLENEMVLTSKTNVNIGGEKAIRRVFRTPNVVNKTVIGTIYVLRIVVISENRVFHFYMNTINSDEFEHYQELMDQISATMTFK